jgi:hypothetical protein
MKHSEHIEIMEWVNRNKLNHRTKIIMLEAYRRIHQFKKGDYSAPMNLLFFPSEVKKCIELGYVTPFKSEIRKSINWYSLTEKGVELLKDLNLEWRPALNEILF